MASRSTIDQALGVIMGQNRITRDEAFAILRAASQHRNVKLREVAALLIENLTGHEAAEPPHFGGCRPIAARTTRPSAPDAGHRHVGQRQAGATDTIPVQWAVRTRTARHRRGPAMTAEHERPAADAAAWSPQALLAETIAGIGPVSTGARTDAQALHGG